MIAVLKEKTVMAGAMYIPSSDILYYSEKGKGVMRNDVRIHVSAETELRNILCSYGMDGSKIDFILDENIMKKEFPILGSSKILHPKLMKLISDSKGNL